MRVLLLPHRFAPVGVGGVERWAWSLAEALGGSGVEVAVLSRDDRRERSLPAFSLVEGAPAGLPHAPTPRHTSVTWIVHRHDDARRPRDAWLDHRFDAPIDAVLDRVRPDVVHVAHVDGWGVVPFRRAARRGLVVGATLHDYKAVCARGQLLPEAGPACAGVFEERCVRCVGDQLRRGPGRALAGRLLPPALRALAARERRPIEARPDPGPAARTRWRSRQRALIEALEGCDVLTAPSDFAVGVHRQAGLCRAVDVVRNAAAGARPPPTPRAPGPLRVGFFGTAVPSKGLDLLLRAAAATEGMELHVHGPPPGPEGPRVRWHGPYPPEEAVARMASVDAVALPSRWPENAPLVAAEARLARRALLVADVGGLPEGVWNGIDGLVLPADDVGAWADALAGLAADPERCAVLGAAGSPPPTPSRMAAAYLRLWARALEGERAP